MAEAYIYDAVRTPRGKGKSSGSLHEITALQLATQVLEALRDRNDLDTSKVDDVILGCVSPVGEQGSDIARTAVMNANYAQTTGGVQVDRFCASGLEACNIAAAKVMTGEADMAIGGGVEAGHHRAAESQPIVRILDLDDDGARGRGVARGEQLDDVIHLMNSSLVLPSPPCEIGLQTVDRIRRKAKGHVFPFLRLAFLHAIAIGYASVTLIR